MIFCMQAWKIRVLTIFSDAFVIDETAFVDKNYVNVNAHELAHQWFGDFVTAKVANIIGYKKALQPIMHY